MLRRLSYYPGCDLAKDVARIRELLNAQGYDADDASIALAHDQLSELRYAQGWECLGRLPDDVLARELVELLVDRA